MALSIPAAHAAAPGPSPAAGPKPVREEPTPFAYIDAATRARMLAQEPLRKAAARIRAAIAAGDDTGFAGLSLTEDHVQVWWKGEPPREAREALADAARLAPVRVGSAPYSLAELKAAARPLRERMAATPGGHIRSVDVLKGGTGLVVGTDGAAAETELRESFAGLTGGVPIRFDHGDAPEFAATRQNDTAPWWGGARIVSEDRATCSIGFPVQMGAWEGILTAGHCGRPGQLWKDGAGDTVGRVPTTNGEQVGHDLLLVSATVTRGGMIYDGGGAGPNPVNTGPQFQKHIRGWEPTWQGEWLCHSGQRSGAVCNWEVENDGTLSYCDYDVFGNWECYDDLYVARQVDGISGIQVGDSGGPVFRPYWETGTSSQSVMAKGIISGLSGDGRRMVLQDFATAVDDWKLWDLRPVISPWLPQV